MGEKKKREEEGRAGALLMSDPNARNGQRSAAGIEYYLAGEYTFRRVGYSYGGRTDR